MIEVATIETGELGDRSYITHDGVNAIVVDPQRDIDRVQEILDTKGLKCSLVLETHIHNDYVSGGLELSRQTGATYALASDDKIRFDYHALLDGDELRTGSMRIQSIATPGHTDGHMSYVVDDIQSPAVVFTGGSLLYGSVGRTDLVGKDKTDYLTRQQFRSAHRLAEILPDDTFIYPTHGFGSFCSSGSATGGAISTVGIERMRNDAFIIEDEDTFVDHLVSGLTAYPSYYAHMGVLNLNGPGPIDLSLPTLVDPHQLRERIQAGHWVIDLRDRVAYAKAHLAGTVGIELGEFFTTYLGWIVPFGVPLTLIGESPDQISAAQRQMVRIGIDRPDAASIGTPEELTLDDPLRSYQIATFEHLARNPKAAILDVRRHDERKLSSIPGSMHIPLHDLTSRIDELPDETLWVHCAGAYRASVAASILDRAQKDVILINDDYSNAIGTVFRPR